MFVGVPGVEALGVDAGTWRTRDAGAACRCASCASAFELGAAAVARRAMATLDVGSSWGIPLLMQLTDIVCLGQIGCVCGWLFCGRQPRHALIIKVASLALRNGQMYRQYEHHHLM